MKNMRELINKSIRTFASVFCECIGVLLWVIGFSFQDDSWLFIFINLGFWFVGSLLIWGALKINPDRICRIMNDDICEPEKEKRHNYSSDFEKLYKYTAEYKVEQIVESIRKEKISEKKVMNDASYI